MIAKDIEKYARENWAEYLESVAEISKSKPDAEPLVHGAEQLFNFDRICEAAFADSLDNKPASVDAMAFHESQVELIEFKSGFKKRITRENRDPQKAQCKYRGEICDDYWDIFGSILFLVGLM